MLDYFVISETKLDDSFPTAQFNIEGYEVRARRDRDKNGGGLIEFVKQGVICRRLKEYETKTSESICSELIISKKKLICFSIYRPPATGNIKTFFDEMKDVISKATCKYENILVMGDFNIDINNSSSDKEKLVSFCDLFGLTNIVLSETCFMKK